MSPEERAKKLIAQGFGYRKIAKLVGVSDRQARKWVKGQPSGGRDPFPITNDERVTGLTARIANLSTELKDAQKYIRSLEREREKNLAPKRLYDDFLTSFKAVSGTAPPIKYKVPVKVHTAGRHKETVTAVWSDWHFGAVTSTAETLGFQKFNTAIAASRVYELVQSILQIHAIHSKAFDIERIVVLLLGDMINSSCGGKDKQRGIVNEFTDPVCVFITGCIIEMAIKDLMKLGIPIEVRGLVGNHPRLTEKMPSQQVAVSNLDWLIYKMIERRFMDCEQVTFKIPYSSIDLYNIYDWRFLISHGFSTGGSFTALNNWKDRVRAMLDFEAYRKANKAKGSTYDLAIIGHLHASQDHEDMMVNGNLPGMDEYGVSRQFRAVRALQWFFGTSKSHKTTFQYKIDVTDCRAESGNPYADFVQDIKEAQA